MTIVQYLDAVKLRLLAEPLINHVKITRERYNRKDGYLRARVRLQDGSLLEFAEYIQRTPAAQINVVTYSYHWGDTKGSLIRRWDNTPHFPHLPNFPHHIHDGETGTVIAGRPINIFQVLDDIARRLAP